jgi:parvulin-like peptidyl-prolyl isomerase
MPTKQLSEIIEAENGFHVVLVTDHEKEKIVPFIDAQTSIRKKVKLEKLQKKQTEYFENLKQKFYVIVLRKNFNLNIAKPISQTIK